MGIFVGGLIMSLAEVLDVFPILLRRGRIQSGIPWMVLSIGIGKMLGAYLYFSKSLKQKGENMVSEEQKKNIRIT